jgi:hypothetical protein
MLNFELSHVAPRNTRCALYICVVFGPLQYLEIVVDAVSDASAYNCETIARNGLPRSFGDAKTSISRFRLNRTPRFWSQRIGTLMHCLHTRTLLFWVHFRERCNGCGIVVPTKTPCGLLPAAQFLPGVASHRCNHITGIVWKLEYHARELNGLETFVLYVASALLYQIIWTAVCVCVLCFITSVY